MSIVMMFCNVSSVMVCVCVRLSDWIVSMIV